MPVLVGAGQLTQRVEPEDALEPVDMMVEAARLAADDAKAPGLLSAVDSIRVVSLLSWRYRDPGALVGARLGATPRETALTTMGGNSPQALLNATCLGIAAGQLDVALVTGAEAWRTRMAFRKAGERPDWTVEAEDAAPGTVLGEDLVMNPPAEADLGIVMPVQVYPLFENALRAAAGRSLVDHDRHVAELWSRFSAVAAENPHSWARTAMTAEEIRTVSPANRMVGFPYRKVMNSNNDVDQASALLLCSVEAARAGGVPEDRWVFPHAGTDAHDHPYVSNRADMVSSPAMRIAGGAALALAGIGPDDLAHVDLYSCFPSAVQIAAAELGLSLERPLTVTGGMSFAGGPWNNYVGHSVATMLDRLRDDAGAYGLCTANGGYVTKHSFGVYSTTPPTSGFRYGHPQDEVDALPARPLDAAYQGPVTVESSTVMHERDGRPGTGIGACLTPEGARTWATTTDEAAMRALTSEEWCGRPATVRADHVLDLGSD